MAANAERPPHPALDKRVLRISAPRRSLAGHGWGDWRRYVDRPILYLFEYDDEWMVDGAAVRLRGRAHQQLLRSHRPFAKRIAASCRSGAAPPRLART